uniref:Uncharacterized protein n=1 Tax=Rhizophora mucronata TaxID=61149 RepID=A0A2P2PZP8_RHIMU
MYLPFTFWSCMWLADMAIT